MIKRLNRLYGQLLLGLVLLCTASIHAQQTHLLLDPTGAGGFELGTTFESNGWTVINETQTNKWVLGAVPEWFAGNRGAYISNDNGVSNAYSHTVSRVHFYRDLTFPVGAETININLDVFQAGESSFDNVMVYIADTNITPSSVGPSSSATAVTSWTGYVNGTTGYFLDRKVGASTATLTNLNIVLNADQIDYVSGNTKRLIITWKNDGGGGTQPPGSVDNIKVEAYVPVCYMVNDLSTSDITNTSFTTNWTPETNISGYSYEVRTSGLPGSGSVGLLSNGNLAADVATFNATGLFGNATYYIYVRKNCSDVLGSSQWKTTSVTTLCGISTYFEEKFDTTPVGSTDAPTVPLCWSLIDSGAGYVYVTTASSFQSVRGVTLANNADLTGNYLVVSPKTDNLGNGLARLRFRAKTTSSSTSPSSTLKVLSLANQDDLVGAQVLQTITLDTDYNEYVVYLPVGTNDYFAFQHGLGAASRVIYIDDVNYELTPSCATPTPLTLVNATSNEVTISWNVLLGEAAGSNLNYEIRVLGSLPGSGDEGLAASGNVNSSTGQVTVTGLDHSEEYVFYIKAVCGTDEDTVTSIKFNTSCQIGTVIYQDFENTLTNGTAANPVVPYCWGAIDSGAGYVYVTTGANYESGRGQAMSNGTDTTGNYLLVSPETNNLGNGGYRLRFRAKTTSTSTSPSSTLKVVTLANQNDLVGMQEIQDITLTTEYQEYYVNLPEGTNDYFAFKHGLGAASRVIYIDDVNFEPIPNCSSPTELIFDSATLDSVTITYELPSGLPVNAQFEYEVRTSGLPGSGAEGLVSTAFVSSTTNTFTINGLDHSSVYMVYLRANCGAGTADSWREVRVITLCGVNSIITENFDTTPIGSSSNQSVPLCWAVISTTPGSAYVSSSAQYESVRGVYMTNGANTTNDILLVSPETDNLGNGDYRIRFRARSTTSTLPATSLNVVTLQNQLNTNGMINVLGIDLTEEFQEYVVNLPAGSNDFFAFKHGLSAESRVIHIDEVYYEQIPACTSPVSLTVSNLTSSSLTLTWPIMPNLEADVNYEYEIRTSGEPGSGTEGLTTTGNVLANAGQVLLTDIPHSTNFTLYLRGNCGVNETDIWREVSFTTLCGIYTEIEEGFDTTPTGSSTNPSLPLCWSYIDSSAGNLRVDASADYQSTNGIYMTNGADVENELILISPETDNLGNGNYRIKFRARTTSSSPTDLQIVTLDNVENTNGINYLEDISLTSVFEEYIVYLPAGTHDFFGFKHGLTATSRVIYIDEIVYEPIPPCPSVVNFEFATSTVNSATFNWFTAPNTPENANLFYEVRTSGAAGSGETGLVTSGTLPAAAGTGTITGLVDASIYQIYVKTVCENDGFDFWTQIQFTTSCFPFDILEENFDTTSVGSATNQTIPVCWKFIDEGVGSGYVSTGSNFSAPNGFYMTNGADVENNYVLVSPETNNLGNGNSRLRFRAKTTSTSGEELEIYSIANNSSMQGATLVSTVQLTTSYTEYIVYFPAGANDYFGLKHGQTGNSRIIYIDNVVLEPIPSCVQVASLSPNINLGQNLINVAWTNPNQPNLANNFEVQYGAAGFELGSGTSLIVEGLSTDITGFVLNEEYDFYVRRICSDTDKSTWFGPVRVLYNYCASVPTSNDGLGISQFVLGESTFTIGDVFYENLLGTTVNINSEAPVNSSITFLTGYTYHTHIWIDFNRDGVFDNESELFFSGESSNANPTTLDTTFEIDDVYESGVYRMRVGTADSGQLNPNPCYSGGYGVTIDVNVNVSFPCLVPVELEVIETTSNAATLNWEAAGSNFTIEYGPQGFQPGTGTVLTNVNKPYVLTGLNEATRYTFYVKQVCDDATTELSEGLNFETLCGTPAPLGDWSQPFVEDDLVSMLNIQGENLKYYLDANMTQEVQANTPLVEGLYYVTQTLFCESESPLEVLVTLIPRIDEPIVVANQQFCNSAIISDLQVTGLAGATVNWYTTNVGGEPLSANTVLNTGTYYVNQTDGTTTSHRVVVNVVINQVPVDLASTEVLLCGYSSFGAVNVGQEVGAVTKWYASLTSTTPLSNNQQAVTGTYYVTQSFGICESNKVLIEIIAYDALPSPVAAIQTFCGSGAVSQLVAQGVANANLKWYSSSASTVELTGNTQLASGTYYVEQSINGCVSPRKAVAVRVVSMTAPNVEDFYLCGSGTVADLVIYSQSGVTHKWYNSPSSTTELNQNVALSTGLYFVSKVQYGCESNRTPVQVTIGAIPDGPTGIQNQTFIEGSVISDLSLDQDNVVWYISYNDSQTGNNPLESEMPLVNGTTYYAVIIGENGCPSLPLPVVVDVYLSNNDFVKDELKYYPNPVSDLLTITYSDRITQIEVYDLLGKLVKSKQTDDKEINIDLSDLSSGTYMVQLKTDSKQQFIKVVKK